MGLPALAMYGIPIAAKLAAGFLESRKQKKYEKKATKAQNFSNAISALTQGRRQPTPAVGAYSPSAAASGLNMGADLFLLLQMLGKPGMQTGMVPRANKMPGFVPRMSGAVSPLDFISPSIPGAALDPWQANPKQNAFAQFLAGLNS